MKFFNNSVNGDATAFALMTLKQIQEKLVILFVHVPSSSSASKRFSLFSGTPCILFQSSNYLICVLRDKIEENRISGGADLKKRRISLFLYFAKFMENLQRI